MSDVLDGRIALLDIAVDEGGDIKRSRVDLVLGLGDVQLAEKLLEDLDGLGVLILDVLCRVRRGGSGSHVCFCGGCRSRSCKNLAGQKDAFVGAEQTLTG